MNVLITGASGFVGGYIVEYALQKDWNVFAAIRKSSNKQYLTDDRIKFLEMDFSSEESISISLSKFKESHGNLDYVIHNAGITKSVNLDVYDRINHGLTKQFIESLTLSDHTIKKFVYISSMAAAGPGSETTYKPIEITDKGMPVSAYGHSKKKAELFIKENCQLPYVILRPPAVFGPRDKDVFTVFDIVNKGFEVYVGKDIQKLSFVYVKDLARLIVEVALSDINNKTFFASDNDYYDNVMFHNVIKNALNKKTTKIRLPRFVIKFVATLSEFVSKLNGNVSKLTKDAYKELTCLNWTCNSAELYNTLEIEPMYTLEEAIKETAEWYKRQGWLK